MNYEDFKKVELELAAERLRRAIKRMKDDNYPSNEEVRIEPKGLTLYTVYNKKANRGNV